MYSMAVVTTAKVTSTWPPRRSANRSTGNQKPPMALRMLEMAGRSASLLRLISATHTKRSRRPSSRQEQDVARLDVGSPARILTEGGDRRQCRDLLAALDDEGLIAKALTDRCGLGGRVLVRAGQ